ncbi:hypothetical protein GCM10009805_20010 [Leucobacter chromiireducens subsp. solipictus]
MQVHAEHPQQYKEGDSENGYQRLRGTQDGLHAVRSHGCLAFSILLSR